MKPLLAVALVVAAAVPVVAQQVYRPGDDGVTLPVLVKSVKPHYTPAAMKQRIEGAAQLDCVVLADGKVGDVSIVESLDAKYGLDEEAISALKQWEFRPGRREGKPVAVRVHVMMSFRLK